MNGLNNFARRLLFLPEQASTFAIHIDRLHYFVITVTMVMSFLVGATALLFFVRYRRRREGEFTPRVEPSIGTEVLIVVVPLAFFLLWFVIGYRDFIWLQTPPANATDVYVMGKKWMWKFAYPEGPNAIGVLRVPVGRPIRLLMTSQDVIHSFYVPAFRIKQDVLPGRYTQTWFEATQPGRFQVLCAEYCGTSHSQMWGEVVVMPEREYNEWLVDQKRGLARRQDGTPASVDAPLAINLVEQGRKVSLTQGCVKCHTEDGSAHIGPSFLNLYGRREQIAGGEAILADEAYLTQSMMDPLAKLVAGYAPVMPTYQGKLTGPQTAALVEYIKSLRSETIPNVPARRPVYEQLTGR